MIKDFMHRPPLVRAGSFGPKRLFGGTSGQDRPLVGANDTVEVYKWPRPLRIVVALAFGSSIWFAILARIQL